MPLTDDNINIGTALMESGTITGNQLNTALNSINNPGNRISNVLVELGYVTENQLVDIVAKKLNLPRLELKEFEINPAVVRLIPFDLARKFSSLPVFLRGNVLTIATDDPLDRSALEEISSHTRKEIRTVVAKFTEIQFCLEKYRLQMDVENI
jgi:type IV pilus assembly protein PilB